MKHPKQTGLTLLEVVIAVALLAALTVVVVPMLVDATKATLPTTTEEALVDPTDLREFAAAFLSDPKHVAELQAIGDLRAAWTDGAARRDVSVRRIKTPDRHRPHDWVEFRAGDASVVLYLARPREDEREQQTASMTQGGGGP